MSGRLSRFLHLERSRGEEGRGPGERPRLQGESRFSTVAGPGRAEPPPPAAGVPEAHVERFRTDREAPLALEGARAGRQPFTRCMRCKRDHSLYATACETCGADLRSEAQRAFNEALWRERQEASQEEREGVARLEQARAEAAAGQALERVQYERMMEQVRKEEGRSFAGWLARVRGSSPGVALLRLVPGVRARLVLLGLLVLVPVVLVATSPRHSTGALVGRVAGFILLLAFVPPGGWRRRRRRWWR